MAFERIKKVGKYQYRLLVENVWDPVEKKTKQRTIRNLGRADRPIPPSPLLQTTGTYSPSGGYVFIGKNIEVLEKKKYKIDVYLL